MTATRPTPAEIHALPDAVLNERLGLLIWERADCSQIEGWSKNTFYGDPVLVFVSPWGTPEEATRNYIMGGHPPDFCHDHGLIGPVAETLEVYASPYHYTHGTVWAGRGPGISDRNPSDSLIKTRALTEASYRVLLQREEASCAD